MKIVGSYGSETEHLRVRITGSMVSLGTPGSQMEARLGESEREAATICFL